MRKLILIFLFLFFAFPAYASLITTVDQQNPGPFETTNGSLTTSFGQSFTPTLSAIDAIEFLLGGNATVKVLLRHGLAGFDGLGGSIVAQSEPILVDQYGSHFFHFDFPERVFITPGDLYVAEMVIMSGSYGVRHTQNNLYTGGQFLHGGWSSSSFRNTDLVFTEGLTNPIPEPATIFLVFAGLFGIVGIRIGTKKSLTTKST